MTTIATILDKLPYSVNDNWTLHPFKKQAILIESKIAAGSPAPGEDAYEEKPLDFNEYLINFFSQKLSITFFPRPSMLRASFETKCFNFSFKIS